MMAVNNIIMWNSAGFRTGTGSTLAKFSFLDKQYPNANFAIAALVETHHTDALDYAQDLGRYDPTHKIIHTPVHNETHSGIVLLVRKDFKILRELVAIPGRLLNVKLQKGETKLNLSVFYGPQWAKMKKDEIAGCLGKFEDLHDPDDVNVILGDFNFVDFDIDKGKKMDSRDKSINPIWETFLSERGMTDPFRAQCPKKKLYSFVSPQGGKSRGDRVYISEEKMASIKNFKYTNTPFGGAHKLMTFELRSGQGIGPGTWKMNSSYLHEPAYVAEIEGVVQELEDIDVNPIDWWDLFTIVVQGTTISYSKHKAKIKKSLKTYLTKQLQSLEQIDRDKMNLEQRNNYEHYKTQLNSVLEEEIRGHEIRTRGLPKYEINEPDISTYSNFEKRYQAKNVIYQLQDTEGQIQTDNKKMIQVAEKFYTKLFSKLQISKQKQKDLLRNVHRKLSDSDRIKLDAELILDELEEAVMDMQDGKSPGLDGITAEFYKKFWYLIKNQYLEYIRSAKILGFHDHRNTSVTTLVFKHKGHVYELDNYRPIALINVDIKILTKALSNRLRPVLDKIIHHSQTAVDNRKIDYTVHMLRDLIDLINKENSEGALIFLDQEKAFDRVDHDFLYSTMAAFGIGEKFTDWLRIIYSNAATIVKVNGFHTNPITLRRGLRQGCSLSPSLYVLVIEIFALALRANQNIVGFKVGGERIVSLHYADDATIVITQNRCFKEVIKEIQNYEAASGARVNYEKTEGLWLGKWKDRTDKPLNIKWTNKNVKNLGLYFGNEDPAQKTFQDIIPKVKKSMNFWKQFKLCKFSKSRVVEIFHASRLWYAISFYPLQTNIKHELQRAFKDYVNFPQHNNPTVAEDEMKKLRLDGGIKLIDIQTKLEAYRATWMLDLTENPNLRSHVAVIKSLIGTQKGGITGLELIFLDEYYTKKILKVPASPFYAEAIRATSKLPLKKRIEDLSKEKVFYNPIFRNVNLKTIPIPRRCEREEIYTYGEVIDEYTKQSNGQEHKSFVANIFPKIVHTDLIGRKEHTVFITKSQAQITIKYVTCKDIYGELLQKTYKEHHSEEKWENKFSDYNIDWPKVWESVNNKYLSEEARTIVWEQIHLNDYCTYSYNKWHSTQDKCPLCLTVPLSKFHLTLECDITNQLWNELEPHLVRIANATVTDTEKVFGLVGASPNINLRNWLTFQLRQCIANQERAAYHNKLGPSNIKQIKSNYNEKIKSELWQKYLILQNLEREQCFRKFFAVNNYLITWEHNNWQVLTLF